MDIKGTIKAKGFTIQEVADRIGVNRVTLTLTLQGNPTYKKMKEIADAIGCNVRDFFEDEVESQESIKNPQNENVIVCPECGTKIEFKKKEG